MAGALAGKQERPSCGDDQEPASGERLPRSWTRPIAEIEPTELVELAKGIETRGASDMAKRILQIVWTNLPLRSVPLTCTRLSVYFPA